MNDPHKSLFLGSVFPENAAPIVPDDNADLPLLPLAVRFNVAGTVRLALKNDVPITLNVFAGELLAVRVKRIFATGTNVGGITIYW